MKKDKISYKQNLKHLQPIGATFFVTCSLKGAIPSEKLQEIKESYQLQKGNIDLNQDPKQVAFEKNVARRKYVQDLDDQLDENSGPTFLEAPDIARILLARVESHHMRYYKLLALTIMPNHFHMLIDTSIQIKGILEPNTVPDNYINLDEIMQSIKGGTARYINQWRNTVGEQVWQTESFDVYIRDEKMLERVVNYISENPVKARIVSASENHPFTFINAL